MEAIARPLPAPANGPAALLQNLGRLPARALVGLMVAAAAAIAAAVGAWMWAQQPDYKVLFSNLADRDGGAIVAALTTMNVPYKFSEGGGAILVPSTSVHDVRLRLAAQGLPKGSTVGFELVDNQKFGATQFQEQINYQRGLEGELAKSIQTLSAVQSARVHLAIPKQTVFLREQQGPSASVVLTLYPGKTLERSQVAGIVNLVASSVSELSVNNVSILDQNGSLLSRTGPDAAGGLDPAQLSYIKQIEQATIQRITDILEPIVGRANVRVQVTADVDFASVESMAETFKPNQDPKVAAVRTQQSSQQNSGGAAGAQGVPGALTNQPPAGGTTDPKAAAAPPVPAAGGTGRKEETVSYEVDRSIQHTKAQIGGIKRLTAAVVINNRHKVDDKGVSTATPIPPAELEQFNALVREAMGYSKERGDSLNVVNAAFNEGEKEPVVELPLWKQPENVALAKDVGRYTLFAALAAYLFFGVLRPLLRHATRPVAAPLVAASAGTAALSGPAGSPELAQPLAGPGDTLQLARKIARDDPKIVANVVKQWVTQDE